MKDHPTQHHCDDELTAIDARLAVIDTERKQLLERKQALLAGKVPLHVAPLSPDQKIALFQNLFRGRTDVFATRWQNAQGRSGYAVACHNEWVAGLCHKPKVKCGDCPNRHFKSLNAQAIYDHLSGKHVAGLYPLLADNSCYFLAADFDDSGWQDAVKALAQSCREQQIPYAIEISRSGNGAHLWILFAEKVQASIARKLGFALLDKAMEIHPRLSFDAYDRLFPNQDVMPAGGFGNLIALPLQQEARKSGNTLFVDDQLHPHQDQWAFLAQLQRLSVKDLSQAAARLAPTVSETRPRPTDTAAPWEQGLRIEHSKINNCPAQITITLANRLYIPTQQIPAQLTARLKRVASFANPVFFKTQAMRFSTHGIPRYITCATIERDYLALPRGCLDDALTLFSEQSIAVDFDDKRSEGTVLEGIRIEAELRADQEKAVSAITRHCAGILHAPTAFGKTVTAIGIIAERKVSTLILTHSRQLLDQWKARIGTFLTGVDVGIIGGGKKKPSGQIDIATYQSLINKKDNSVVGNIHQYGQVIIDECHHISAPRYEMLLDEVRAKFVVGLTATPDRQDRHQKIMFMLAGPVRHKVKSDSARKFDQVVIVTQRHDPPPLEFSRADTRPHISAMYRWLAENTQRNQNIVDDVIQAVGQNAHCLLLTERREHADVLSKMLESANVRTVVLRGAMRTTERKDAAGMLDQAQVVVATGKYVGEGFDLPRLDTLFLALPIAWKGSLAQYAGRIHREVLGKTQVTIYDYVDCSLPVLRRMYQKREKGYQSMGYNIKANSNPEQLAVDI